jgi:hypothetical protein
MQQRLSAEQEALQKKSEEGKDQKEPTKTNDGQPKPLKETDKLFGTERVDLNIKTKLAAHLLLLLLLQKGHLSLCILFENRLLQIWSWLWQISPLSKDL